MNVEGKLFTLVYGDLSAMESRPIEIKPFFHYWPGSTSLTVSTWSCNFRCPWCQNSHLSRTLPDPFKAAYVEPSRVVELALAGGDRGVCVSFQEPTLLADYALDLFQLASSKGLYCCFVSNGYMTLKFMELLKRSGLDGMKIDVKGGRDVYQRYLGGLDLDVVWRNAREAKRLGIHVEIVNLVITAVNDNESDFEDLARRHLKELGEDTPLHFTRYYPAHEFHNPPTDVNRLEVARDIAASTGVRYSYVGNVPGHPYENTYCPACGRELIRRLGYAVLRYDVTAEKRCPSCGIGITIVGPGPVLP